MQTQLPTVARWNGMLVGGRQVIFKDHLSVRMAVTVHQQTLIVLANCGATIWVVVASLNASPHQTLRSAVDGTVLIGKVQKAVYTRLVGKSIDSCRMDEQIPQTTTVDGAPSIDKAKKLLYPT